MKNALKYYYNIYIDDIKQIDLDYYFQDYVLKLYYKNIDIELYNYLLVNNLYIHQIIYNRDNEYITIINDKPYILLKISDNKPINMNYIVHYNIPIINKKSPNWAFLWSNKVDNLERNINNIKDDIIKKTCPYFIGMTENAILLFKAITPSNNLYICHIRFYKDIDFYDPMNIIIDYKMRDYAEYIKNEFYKNNKYYYDFIEQLINKSNYNEVMLFFIRMLYPTSFYDAYDNYLKNEKIDYDFYNKRNEYEKYLKDIYHLISQKYNVININWLK